MRKISIALAGIAVAASVDASKYYVLDPRLNKLIGPFSQDEAHDWIDENTTTGNEGFLLLNGKEAKAKQKQGLQVATASSVATAAGRTPKKDHLYEVLSLFKSLKLDVIAALRKMGFKLAKVKGTAGTMQIDGFDGKVQATIKKLLTEAGFKIKEAKDRHGNTNLIVDLVFKDFMNLDLQVCSITSTGKLFSPPKRLSGLEVKMLKALLKSGVYQPRAAAQIAQASDATASKDSAKVYGGIIALHPTQEFVWDGTPIADVLKQLSGMKGFEFGKDWKWAGDQGDDEANIYVSGVDKKHSSFYGPMALVAFTKYFHEQADAVAGTDIPNGDGISKDEFAALAAAYANATKGGRMLFRRVAEAGKKPR